MLGRVTDAIRTPQPDQADSPDSRIIDRRNAAAGAWVWGDQEAGVPPDAPLAVLVSAAVRLLGAFWGCTLQRTGVSPSGLGVLRLLAARDGLMSSEVAARGWSTPGTVTSIVDTLVRDGYVERRRDARDRRVVRLYLKEQGRRKAEETISVIGPRWHDAFDYVDPADEPAVRRFLVNTIDRFGMLVREGRGA
jgi:DNA-binding MarR family transcriptional regulator